MDNLRGILLMNLSMALFALADMFIKLASGTMGRGQVILALGVGGTVIFATMALVQGRRLHDPLVWHRAVVLRNVMEVVGVAGMVSALALAPLSTVAAILQAAPLTVTLGAALFLREPVGWRRWVAIVTGFAGVLLVVRPGVAGFEPAALLAVVGMFGLSARDLCTRAAPAGLSNAVLGTWAHLAILPCGLAWALAFDGALLPAEPQWWLIAGLVGFGISGYLAITAAVRAAPISVVAPFRYSRLVFAMALGVVVFGERPDAATLAGSALIIGSGLYALWRESRRRRLHSTGPAG